MDIEKRKFNRPSSWFLLQRHPGGNAKASHGEATYSQVPRDGRRPSVHDLPCEASRSAKMGEGRSDRNLYAHGGAARRRNQGGDRGSAPTLGSQCRDPCPEGGGGRRGEGSQPRGGRDRKRTEPAGWEEKERSPFYAPRSHRRVQREAQKGQRRPAGRKRTEPAGWERAERAGWQGGGDRG